MRIRFLGTDSQNGGSPTLYATDRDTLAVRGYVITDRQALADLGKISEGEAVVEIPVAVLRFYENPMTFDPRKAETPDDGAGEGMH